MDHFNDFYRDKTVLITGHTGFKGSWLSIWLHELGANVVGFALPPFSEKDNFVLSKVGEKITDIRGDVKKANELEDAFNKYHPDIVFHLAAQPLVRYSYDNPVGTYETNVMGTINVLEAIRKTESVKVGIMITTDKCYDNVEQIWGYRECDPLGGYDPYSSSKAAAEIAINSWRQSFFNSNNYNVHGKSIASVRAGNVIGGGDWATDRIIPDCIRSLESGVPIAIRSPKAVRPWEHVLEPLSGYLMLAEKMYNDPISYAEAWNFGPDQNSIIPVWDVAKAIVDNYGFGSLDDVSDSDNLHEAKLLSLDISKARYKLGWVPTLDIAETIKLTSDWYKTYNDFNAYEICKSQITYFAERGGY